MSKLESLKAWAKRLKRDAVMLWFARKHPRTPALARWMCVLVVAYVLSPIDLIPDFIPVLGYLDEVILVPVFIWLILRMLPEAVVSVCRAQAEAWMQARQAKPVSYLGAAIVVTVWLLFAGLIWRALA